MTHVPQLLIINKEVILLIEYVINNSLLGSALEIIPPTSSSDEPVVQPIQLIEETHARFDQ